MADKRAIEIKAREKGMLLKPWENNDPTIPDNAVYWLVDEELDLPIILDPVPLSQIDETLNTHRAKTDQHRSKRAVAHERPTIPKKRTGAHT